MDPIKLAELCRQFSVADDAAAAISAYVQSSAPDAAGKIKALQDESAAKSAALSACEAKLAQAYKDLAAAAGAASGAAPGAA